MAKKEKIFRITILREGGSYVALCPELGVEARAETKEEAKARVADMINASLGLPQGGDESLSPPTPSPRSFWKIFRKGPAPSPNRWIRGEIAAMPGGYALALTLVFGGLLLLYGILSLVG